MIILDVNLIILDVNVIILDVNMIILDVNMIFLDVDKDKSHVYITTLYVRDLACTRRGQKYSALNRIVKHEKTSAHIPFIWT